MPIASMYQKLHIYSVPYDDSSLVHETNNCSMESILNSRKSSSLFLTVATIQRHAESPRLLVEVRLTPTPCPETAKYSI